MLIESRSPWPHRTPPKPEFLPKSSTSGNEASTPATVAQKLTFNLGTEPAQLDPQLNEGTDGSHMINNTFEGLVREINGVVTPAVATSWTISDDGLVYTFTLNPNAKWSDGQQVVAGDFEYAWKRAVNPATGSKYADIFVSANVLNASEIISGTTSYEELGVKALDDLTLEVTLANPTEYFLGLTGFPTFMPVREDVVDNDGIWARDPQKVISNGPFVLNSYSLGDRLTFAKNPYYWNTDNVSLEEIEVRFITDSSTALTAFNSGDLMMNSEIPSEEVPRLIVEDPEFYTHACFTSGSLGGFLLSPYIFCLHALTSRMSRSVSSPVKRSFLALGKSAIIIATCQGAKRTWLLKGMGHHTLIGLLNDTPITHPCLIQRLSPTLLDLAPGAVTVFVLSK